jgi:predicted lipase
VVTTRDLVLAAAATYTAPVATFVGLSGTVRACRTVVGDTAVYAIEGTHDPLGWALDFMALPVPAHGTVEHPDIGWVHGGMNAALDSIYPALQAAMLKDDKYAVTGHSLGAALALMATGCMVAAGHPPVQWAAFAPPRVGFKKLIDLVATVPGTGYRNGNDPVPMVPLRAEPMWLYEQVPLLRGGTPLRPPWNDHHMALYVALEAALSATKGV